MLCALFSNRNLILFIFVLTPYLCLAIPNNDDINFVPLNFDDIKNKLFDDESSVKLPQFRYNVDSRYNHPQYDDQACNEELAAIAMSLKNFDFWAIKRNFNLNIDFCGDFLIIFFLLNQFWILGENCLRASFRETFMNLVPSDSVFI